MNTEIPRVLIIGPGHPARVAGSAEIAAYDLFRELGQTGQVAVTFLGCARDRSKDHSTKNTLDQVDGSPNEYLLSVGEFDPFMLAHGIDSRSLDDFGRFLERTNPDLVHFHHLGLIGAESLAVVRNRLPQARIVFTLHDFHPVCYRGGLMTKTRTGELCDQAAPEACHACFNDLSPERFTLRSRHFRNMLGLVDRFAAPSRFLRQRYSEWGLPQPLIEWIPGGLPETVQPVRAAARSRRNRFGFFGNIAPHKGPILLLEAVRRIDPTIDLTLTIHGALEDQNGVFASAFDQALDRAGDRVRYRGPYERRSLARLVADVDWVVVPSTWWENAPLTIVESFRLGRPVITADVGGMAELVDQDVNGHLFRHNDPSDLAEVMARASADPDGWSRMVASLPSVPTMAEVAGHHLALYDDLVAAPQRRTA